MALIVQEPDQLYLKLHFSHFFICVIILLSILPSFCSFFLRHLCVHWCVCTCIWKPDDHLWCPPQECHPHLLRHGLSQTWSSPIRIDCLASEPQLFSWWDHNCTLPWMVLHGFWGVEFRSSCFWSKQQVIYVHGPLEFFA